MWLTLVLLAVLLLAVLRRVYVGLFAGSSPNPFSEDVKRPPAPLVTDKEARKRVLKQGQWKGPCARRLHRLAISFPQGELLPEPGLSFSLCEVLGRLVARGPMDVRTVLRAKVLAMSSPDSVFFPPLPSQIVSSFIKDAFRK